MKREIRITTANIDDLEQINDLIKTLQKIKRLADGNWIYIHIDGDWKF